MRSRHTVDSCKTNGVLVGITALRETLTTTTKHGRQHAPLTFGLVQCRASERANDLSVLGAFPPERQLIN